MGPGGRRAHRPTFNVLTKFRHGVRDVEDSEKRRGRNPVPVDDIICATVTGIRATRTLLKNDHPTPIRVGVHAIFAGDAYFRLKQAGATSI